MPECVSEPWSSPAAATPICTNPGCAFAPGKAAGGGPGRARAAPVFKSVQRAAPAARLCGSSECSQSFFCLCRDCFFSALLPNPPSFHPAVSALWDSRLIYTLIPGSLSPEPRFSPPFWTYNVTLSPSSFLLSSANKSYFPGTGLEVRCRGPGTPSGKSRVAQAQLSGAWAAGSVLKLPAHPVPPRALCRDQQSCCQTQNAHLPQKPPHKANYSNPNISWGAGHS